MMLKTIFVVVFAIASINAQLDPVTKDLVNTMLSYRDATVNPCDDFYQYACGNFIKNNPPPANSTEPYIFIPCISGISYTNDAILDKIVNQPWPYINDLYQSCMMPAETQTQNLISTVHGLNYTVNQINIDDSTSFIFGTSTLSARGIANFYGLSVQQDENNPQLSDVYLTPTGYSEQVSENVTQYSQEIVAVQTALFGVSEADATKNAAYVVQIEEWLYAASQSTSPSVVVPVSEVQNTIGLNIEFALINYGINIFNFGNANITIANPGFYASLGNLSSLFTQDAVHAYLTWRIQTTAVSVNPLICMEIDPEYAPLVCPWIAEFYPEPAPWTQDVVCRYFTYDILSDLVGLVFSTVIVNEEVTEDIIGMTTNIQKAFGSSLNNLTWLDAASLDTVMFKLDNVLQIIGHPNALDRYEGLYTNPTSLYSNLIDIAAVVTPYTITQAFLPFNRSDFEFPPLIVNAFYSPYTNTINFPAGILESPMFSASWAKFFQYSRLGYVVGHENTHGFDNSGSQWNAYGVPGDIFDAATRNNFNEAAQCIAQYYSNYIAYGNVTINGQQTLGENIADIGGVKNSFRAYKNFVAANGAEFEDSQLIKGLTVDQTFFLHTAQTWCTSENEAYLQMQYQDDVHSPSKARVNGPLSQFDEFAAAWQCPATSAMNPASRCNLW